MIIGYDGSKINIAQRTGTENYSYQLLRHILKIDQINNYRLYSRFPVDDLELQASNVKNTVIGLPRLWTQVGLAMEVVRHQPDVLFVPAHTLPIIHPRGLKTVVTIHDLGAEYLPQYHQFPAKLYLNRSTEYVAKYATHIIAVSEFTKQDLIQKMHVDPSRISVVYEGVDLTQLSPAPQSDIDRVKSRYQLDKDYILFVGTIQPRKNLVRLIEAFQQLNSHGVDLVLAGGKGWLSDEIYQAPERLGIADRVKFLGYIDEADKAALYSGAKLTALVSLFEGFGLPIVESMACGTPVVAANASCLPEVVGSAGILVDPYSITNIAEGLHQGLHNAKLRQDLINDGQAQAKKFNWQDAARQTVQIFEMIGKGA